MRRAEISLDPPRLSRFESNAQLTCSHRLVVDTDTTGGAARWHLRQAPSMAIVRGGVGGRVADDLAGVGLRAWCAPGVVGEVEPSSGVVLSGEAVVGQQLAWCPSRRCRGWRRAVASGVVGTPRGLAVRERVVAGRGARDADVGLVVAGAAGAGSGPCELCGGLVDVKRRGIVGDSGTEGRCRARGP